MRTAPYALACILLLAGCESESQRLGRAFDKFPELAQWISQADELQLYEGLPHPGAESELFAAESKRADAVEIDGNYFYKNPLPVDPKTLAELRRLCTTQSLFEPIVPDVAKACGGYHPDWRLVWTHGAESRSVEICFGCYDVKVYGGTEPLMLCDMREVQLLFEVLGPLQTNRPESSLTKALRRNLTRPSSE